MKTLVKKIGNIHFSEFERSFAEFFLCYMDLKGALCLSQTLWKSPVMMVT